jgi:hypothetical protein
MENEILSENILNLIGNKISQHVELYPKIQIKAEYFESIVSSSLGCDWNPMNHNPNQDLETQVTNMKKPQLKSGVIKNGFLTLSSHRTTKHPSLKSKIEFLSSRDYDSYLCFSRDHNTKKTHKYKLVYFDKGVIDWNSMVWVDTYDKKGKHSGYYGTTPNGSVKSKIVFNMSHQVWIEINMSLTTILREYEY